MQSKSEEGRRKTLVPLSLKQPVEGLRKDVVSFRQENTDRPDLLAHPYSALHRMLVQRSDGYRRLYRRYYPLLELHRPGMALCQILGSWLLLQALASQSVGDEPVLLLYAKLSFWGLLLALIGFVLLIILASIRVVSLERQHMLWKKNAPWNEMKQQRT